MSLNQTNYVVLFFIFLVIMFWFMYCAQKRIKKYERIICNQQDDIWNISGRVNQGQTSHSGHWPTHDHHIQVESFAVSDRHAKNMPPPPPYHEVGLPSYEEAIGRTPKDTVVVPVHSTAQTSCSTR